MSDTPKATKMTLEEAVEIVRRGEPSRLITPGCEMWWRKEQYDRARAIVDQAVRFVGACDGNDADDELLKLRALERGESEGKP